MASKYELRAEEILGKLSLIDENKNFLQYPYDGVFPASLIDVGDGSILTSGTSAGQSLTLGAFSLLAGEYQDSVVVTLINDTVVDPHGFSLAVTGEGVSRDDNNVIKVNAETTVTVTLNIPDKFSPDWLIKPQIVKSGEDSTVWVPNMDKIGTYVDRRFNGTNIKINEINKKVESLGTLTEEQLTKVLDFMDCIEIE